MLETAVRILTAWNRRPLADKLAELTEAQDKRQARGCADHLDQLERRQAVQP